MAFKKELLSLLSDSGHGRVLGECHQTTNSESTDGILRTKLLLIVLCHEFVLLLTPGDWLYMTFMHQACVYETKEHYNASHQMVTDLVNDFYRDGMISNNLKEAISSFQIKLHNKQQYLAYYVRKNIRNSFDAMTTSPVESCNNHLKHQSKASTLNNMSKSLMLITEGTDSLIGRIDKGESTKSYWSMCIPIHTELCQFEFVFIPIRTELRQFEFVLSRSSIPTRAAADGHSVKIQAKGCPLKMP